MAGRTAAFWTFIGILIVLHLVLRLGAGLSFIPDLLIVAALLGARRLGSGAAAAYGLALGILADSLAVVAFGATAVAFVIVCYAGSRSRSIFEGDSFLFILGYVFVGTWLIESLRYVISAFISRGAEHIASATPLYTTTPLVALYTGLAAFVALLAYRAATGYR
jgi:rod shape-determining protein MreD